MKCFISIFFIFLSADLLASVITPTNLRVEYKKHAFIDTRAPRMSWELVSEEYNQYQSAYQILVASSLDKLKRNEGDLWDSGKVSSSETNQIIYEGKPLTSKQKVWWKVKVWKSGRGAGSWSQPDFWEMGLLERADWNAQWIGYDLNHLAAKGTYRLPPSPYLRKEALLTKKVKSARLYISSLGLHEFYINGKKIGEDYFASGWTDYSKRVYYNVYDVTQDIVQGPNVFGAILSDGWYAGYLGYALLVGRKQVRGFYGDFPLLKAQVEVTYDDGSKDIVATAADWKVSIGAVVESDFLQGETYDANREPTGWNLTGFDDSGWEAVQVIPDKDRQEIQLHPGHPVRVVKELPVKTVKRIDNGKYIVDFGQNFAGIVKLRTKGRQGDTLILRFGEMLHPDGTLMTENLRKARATDTYILKGQPQGEEWSPRFTFHGFQYVEISGLRNTPDQDFLTGLVMSSPLDTTGHFATDSHLLNKIYSNIVWTQGANYLDIPTDCPQRDERLGWTADAHVYIRSATYNNDIAAFHTKWIRDLNDAQWPNGAFPIYAPMPTDGEGKGAIRGSDTYSPGWSEAGIICTYEIFRCYNDTRIVQESLPYMTRFMDFLRHKAQGKGVFVERSFEEVRPKGGFGDWLSIGKKTSPDLLATLYYFYCARLMEEMCSAVQEQELSQSYNKEVSHIRTAFMKHYTKDGRLKTDESIYGKGEGYVDGSQGFSGHTQTAYANALYMGLFDEGSLQQAGEFLRELVEANGDKLNTGFLGFKPLLPALSIAGSADKAYKLLLSTEYPSLGYEVANGATTIWERWNSYTKGQGFHNAGMNSFSHYAFGSVNEWMFENMVGIRPLERGFRSFEIRPDIPNERGGVNRVQGSFHSIAGQIKSEWDYSGGEKRHTFEVPVNTTAYFCLELPSLQGVCLNGKSVWKSKLVQSIDRDRGCYRIRLGSGKYVLHVKK